MELTLLSDFTHSMLERVCDGLFADYQMRANRMLIYDLIFVNKNNSKWVSIEGLISDAIC